MHKLTCFARDAGKLTYSVSPPGSLEANRLCNQDALPINHYSVCSFMKLYMADSLCERNEA